MQLIELARHACFAPLFTGGHGKRQAQWIGLWIDMETEPKPYLEYLDKEMTIMGILSGFCIAVLLFVVDKIAGAKEPSLLSSLWACEPKTWLIGAVALLVAALLFYRQRSHLAWYYGQIALAQVRNANGANSVENWLRKADSWEAWLYYREGFISLLFGFLQFGVVVAKHQGSATFTLWVPLAGCLGFAWLQRVVFKQYRFHDKPWTDWWKKITPVVNGVPDSGSPASLPVEHKIVEGGVKK